MGERHGRLREVAAAEITSRVAELCVRACTVLPPDVIAAMHAARDREESALGRDVFSRLLDNAALAAEQRIPMCQDTGLAVVFVELGEEARIAGGGLMEAISGGVRQGYRDGYLRSSVVASPLDRRNTGDNAPPVVHTELVGGDGLKITLLAKGAGSENMSRLRMMAPAEGLEAVRRFVVQAVEGAGASACPPVVIGVGLGGNFEECAFLAKKALLRPLGQRSSDPEAAKLEEDLLARVNATGIGPMGIGGTVTALGVNVETYPCHIASLPVAVNLQCHAARHASHEWR